MQDNIKAFLDTKLTGDVFAKYKKGLHDAQGAATGLMGKIISLVGGRQQAPLITKHNAELGLLFLNEMAAYRFQKWRNDEDVVYNSKRYNRIQELLGADEWDNPENYSLLVYFFGDEKAGYARHAWKKIRYQMYQTGYTRRSFRSPANREMYLGHQMNFIARLIRQAYTYTTEYSPEYKNVYTFYDLTVAEQVKYAQWVGDANPSLFMLWASAVDMGNTAVFATAEDIIFNKDEVGKVTTGLIKALLNSDKQEAWQLVEKLLLAAQRQEGLRQTILEALDETSVGALKYIIKVIINNQLARFSSVVRSVDVWAGLGWESERETTVRNFLQKASHYLENPAEIPTAITSENNADVYMALWAQGVYDVEKTIPYLEQLYKNGNAEKRTLALIFANVTGHYKINMPTYYAALNDLDLQPLACAVNFIYHAVQLGDNDKYYNKHYPGLFSALHGVYKRVTVKEKTFESFIFSWLKIVFEKKNILLAMLRLVDDDRERLETVLGYFDGMDADAKRQLTRKILPVQSQYNYNLADEAGRTITDFQRNYAMLILKDRSEYDIAYKVLHEVSFTPKEAEVFPDLLKRKSADFRGKIINILGKQPDDILAPVVEQVLLQGDLEQRLAGLDVVLQLQQNKRLVQETARWVGVFKERKNISQKEDILLSQLTNDGDIVDISAENGYGLFNPKNMTPIVPPAINPSSLYEIYVGKHDYGFSMPFSNIKKAFVDLAATLTQYKDFEYEVEHWDKSRENVLLGNMFRRKSQGNKEFKTKQDEYVDYPLPDVWQAWYAKWNLQPQDLLIISLSLPQYSYSQYTGIAQLPKYKEFIPATYQPETNRSNPMRGVVGALALVHPYAENNEFCIGATTRLFAGLPPETLQTKVKTNYYNGPSFHGWQEQDHLNIFLKSIDLYGMPNGCVKDCWNIYNWRQYSGLPEKVDDSVPPLIIFCRAYKLGIISDDEMYRGLMTSSSIELLSSPKKKNKRDYDYFAEFPFLTAMFDKTRNHLLDIELKRGDTDTPVTHIATGIRQLYGVRRFAEILAGLGKTTLYKGYIYGNSGRNKQELFSTLLKRCLPLPDEEQKYFNESVQKIKANETRLVEAAVYAPQWQKYVSGYLGWKGLDSAIWWMHAHTKTDGYQAQNAEAESEIAKYSSVDIQEFKEGAVDKDWFIKAHKEIGKERWAEVYDAAKYISDGNGHRRARIYADVLLGELNLKDVTEKITTKRDQDYVRIYGLVPLPKNNTEKEVLARYEQLQQFKKESRQFGGQKQTSEALAVRVAMENLARNAGYPDPVRLTWAMETKQVQTILSKETQVQFDDVLIGLVIDDDGQADVLAYKGDKELKALPAKYKKDSKVEELAEYRKTLREQFKRSRKGLEDAMVRGDVFLLHEMENLFSHPVICKHLEKLVFVVDNGDGKIGGHGFYSHGKLIAAEKTETLVTDKDSLRLAHCTDLYKSGAWPQYQQYAFNQKLQQPFKQIFRELYLPTADELQEKTISRRYSGHQVQPKQTAALLRARGWKADYEEGLQKVFHKLGFVAKIYAMADWFSPAEVESPTLETIEFHDLKTYQSIAFTAINERIFSEVMRDIDLVVSVAHVGGVDAEASHSSIEMRAVLLQETLRLFKIKNVEIAGSHAKIKGKLGDYSVHLGSAVVHQIAAGYLSILPVHSQHRGRLFLPFVDDDPKSAEVISKVLLLARDSDIQDPTILSQLN